MIDQADDSSPEMLLVRRTFAASPERLFAAWTDPQLLQQWWGPPGTTVRSVEVDLRVGGRYRIGVTHPERGFYAVSGTYHVIQPSEKLVFSWRWERTDMDIGPSLVTVEFQAQGKQTELLLTHAQLPDEAARLAHREGWQGILENLAIFVTS